MYIDTHCHLSKEDYQDIDKVINNAKKAAVNKIIISGCDKKSIKESIEIIEKYSNVYLSLGYHPSEADLIEEKDLDELKKIIKNTNKIVALGEIGLDYHWNKQNKEKQIWLFEKMLDIARELKLPVVIHSRDAFQDTYDILKKSQCKGVIHCFSGNIENAKMYISIGFSLGIGGVLTFQNSKLKDVIKDISIDKIVSETDSPYLAPVPYRGTKNEPKNIPIIVEEIAKHKKLNIEEVRSKIEQNVKEIFNI